MPHEGDNFDPKEGPVGEFPFAGPGEEILNFGGINRVSVDNQTDIESSNYAEGVKSDIAKGDEKLGREINQVQSEQKQMFDEVNSQITSAIKTIDRVAEDAESARGDLADTIAFNAGDENAELTPARIAALIEEFKTEMQAYIDTVKDEKASEKDVRIATFWLSQFGEVYTPLGFNLWQLKDFSSVEDDLDSATMDEYENVIETIRKEIVSLNELIESLESEGDLDAENQKKLDGYRKKKKSTAENFIRWTDPSDATPDLVETRVATLEKGLQWRFDTEDSEFDEFVNDLNRNVLGTTTAGAYYNEMRSSFEADARSAEDTIASFAEMEKAGEEISQEFELEKAKADFFVNLFGTIPSLIAVKAYEDYKDSYKAVQWSSEVYNQYEEGVETLENLIEKSSEEISYLESLPAEERGEDHDARLKRARDNKKESEKSLNEITCEDPLNDGNRIKCLDGYVYWYVTKHDNEMDKFVTNLHAETLGTTTAGAYYNEMKSSFEAEARYAEDIIASFAEMEKAGEEISQDFELQKAKADFFVNLFGTIPSLIAVKAYEDYKDSYKAVQWSSEVYNQYEEGVETLENLIEKSSEEISYLESLPAEERGEDHDARLKRARDNKKESEKSLNEITCEDPLNDGNRIKCLDGYVYWYVTKHDNEMDKFVTNLHAETLGTTTAGAYYNEMKSSFEAEARYAEDIIASFAEMEKAGEEISQDFELQKAKADFFVNLFGTIPSLIAVTSFEDYKDSYKAVQWSSQVYEAYLEAIDNLKNTIEKFAEEISRLNNTPSEEQGEDHEDRLKKAKDIKSEAEKSLNEITCEDPLSEGNLIECLDGYVYWYVTTHNDEFDRYVLEAREENGFNPSVEVDYLTSKKSHFKDEMENAIALIKASEEEGGEPVDEHQLAEAQEFVNRFGKVVSQTAFHNWLAYNAEERVSDAVGEIFRIVECANEAIVSGVNEIETTSTEVASYYPLPDGKTSMFNLVGTPENYKPTQVFVNGIASIFGHIPGTDRISLLPAPHAGSNLTILLEVKSNPTVSVPLVDSCGIMLPDEIREHSIFTCDGEERKFESLRRTISSTQETLSQTENKIEKATDAKGDLEGLEADLASENKELVLTIAQDNKELADTSSSLEMAEEEASVLEDNLATGEDTLEQLYQELRGYDRQIDSNKAQISILKVSKEAEESRPFPSEEVLEKLTTAIAELEKATKEAEESKVTTESEIDKVETQNDKISDDLNTVRANVSTLTADVDNLNTKISKLNARLKLVITNAIHAQVNIKSQTAIIDKETEKKSDLISEVANLKKQQAELAQKAFEAGCRFIGGKFA